MNREKVKPGALTVVEQERKLVGPARSDILKVKNLSQSRMNFSVYRNPERQMTVPPTKKYHQTGHARGRRDP